MASATARRAASTSSARRSVTNQVDPDSPGREDGFRYLLAAGRRVYNAAVREGSLPESQLGRSLLIRGAMLETEEGVEMLEQSPEKIEEAVRASLYRCEMGHSRSFVEQQSRRGLVSGYVRGLKRDARREKVWQLFDEGWTVAKVLNVRGTELGSRATLFRDRRTWWDAKLRSEPRGYEHDPDWAADVLPWRRRLG